MRNESIPSPGVQRQRGANEIPWLRSPLLQLVRIVRALSPLGLIAFAGGWIAFCARLAKYGPAGSPSSLAEFTFSVVAVFALGLVYACSRHRRRSFLVWLTADLLTRRLFARTPDVSDQPPRGARRVRIHGRLRGMSGETHSNELLRTGYDEDPRRQQIGSVVEAIRPFEVVAGNGSVTAVDIDHVQLAALPFGAPRTPDDVVLHDGDEVFVLGHEDVMVDPSAGERLDRDAPLRRRLRGSFDEPILVLPTGASAARTHCLRACFWTRHLAAAGVIALGLGLFAGYTRQLHPFAPRLLAGPMVERLADFWAVATDPQMEPVFLRSDPAPQHVVLARVRERDGHELDGIGT